MYTHTHSLSQWCHVSSIMLTINKEIKGQRVKDRGREMRGRGKKERRRETETEKNHIVSISTQSKGQQQYDVN